MKFLSLIPISIFILFLPHESNARHWFDYSDCGFICMSNNQPCLIRYSSTGFITECMLDGKCTQSANDHAVCLRENLPPMGGRNIWIPFIKQHPDEPIICSQKVSPIFLIVSFALNIILSVASVIISILCYKNRQRFIRFHRGPTPPESPTLPDSPVFEPQAGAQDITEAFAPLII